VTILGHRAAAASKVRSKRRHQIHIAAAIEILLSTDIQIQCALRSTDILANLVLLLALIFFSEYARDMRVLY
jgi:hypothetical protein